MEEENKTVLPDSDAVFTEWISSTLDKLSFRLFHDSRFLIEINVLSRQDGGFLVARLKTEYENVINEQREKPASYLATGTWIDEPKPVPLTSFTIGTQEFSIRSTAKIIVCS